MSKSFPQEKSEKNDSPKTSSTTDLVEIKEKHMSRKPVKLFTKKYQSSESKTKIVTLIDDIIRYGHVQTNIENRSSFNRRFFVLRKNGDLLMFKNKQTKKTFKEIRVGGLKFYRTSFLRYCIKVELKPEGNFHFVCKNSVSVIKWIRNFRSVGGVYLKKEYLPTTSEKLLQNVENWSSKEVKKFLEDYSIFNEDIKELKKIDITGAELMKLKNIMDLKKVLNLKSLGKRMKLLKILEKIRAKKYLEIIIFQKIDSIASDYLSISSKWKKAEIFCFPSKFLETFLNTKLVQIEDNIQLTIMRRKEDLRKNKFRTKNKGGALTEQLQQQQDDEKKDEPKDKKESVQFEFVEGGRTMSELPEYDMRDDSVDNFLTVKLFVMRQNDKKVIKCLIEEDTHYNTPNLNNKGTGGGGKGIKILIPPTLKSKSKNRGSSGGLSTPLTPSFGSTITNKDFPLMLVVSDMIQSDSYKSLRKFISPFIQGYLQAFFPVGIFHSALIVGPWYLEWHDSSLIQPRRSYSKKAIVCIDLKFNIKTKKKRYSFSNIAKKLAFLITKWNSKMNFRSYKNEPAHGNCQDFVEDLMETLELFKPRSKNNDVRLFLKNLVASGNSEMVFIPTKRMRTVFSFNEKKYVFLTHVQLDEFLESLLKRDKEFGNNYEKQYELLLSFDRAFWLRYLGQIRSNENKPLESGCPFGDPKFLKFYYPFPDETEFS